MKLANFVTKLQDVLRPKQEEIETSSYQKGKRIIMPANDVERVYRHQRKRAVRVTYTVRQKLPAGSAALPFYPCQTAGVATRNTTPMLVSKKHTGSEKRY